MVGYPPAASDASSISSSAFWQCRSKPACRRFPFHVDVRGHVVLLTPSTMRL